MSINTACIILYGVSCTVIIGIFISLSRNLFCANSTKPQRNSHRNRDNNNNNNRRLSVSGPSSNHYRTQSVSSVSPNNIEVIIAGSGGILPSNTDISTTNTNTLTTTSSNPSTKNNILSVNESNEKSRSNHSRTRSLSFSMQIQLPHAVINIVNNIKRMLGKIEYVDYEIHLLVRYASIVSCFGFLICVAMICIYFMMHSIIDNANSNNTATYDEQSLYSMKVISLIFYCIGKYSLYICGGVRLYYCLDGGIFQYNITVYVMIAIYLIISFIITMSALLLIYTKSYQIFIICILVFYFMDAFYLILLYVLFTKQLIKLIENTSLYISTYTPSSTITKTDSNNNKNKMEVELQISSPITNNTNKDNNNNNNNDSNVSELGSNDKSRASLDRSKLTNTTTPKHGAYIDKHKTSAIEYVTKYSVIISWSVLSSILMIIIISTFGINFVVQFDDKIIIHIIWSIDCIINSFALYLYFVFGRWIYKILCGICHNISSKFCQKFISKKH